MPNSETTEKINSISLPFIFSRVMPVIAIGLFILVGFVVITNEPTNTEPTIQDFKSWQGADTPFGYPLPNSDLSDSKAPRHKFNPSFHFHSPWERASIPHTDQFEAAMGTQTWGYTYNAQPFNAKNNLRGGGNHSGDDINGIGGKNSDLNDPVFAVANGLVVYVGEPSPGWGTCIILAHRTPDGKIIHSMYAHLLNSHVAYMQQIPRGKIIGTVGNANNAYLAHLHLEIRESDGVSPFLSGYPSLTQHDRLNPTKIINKYAAKDNNIFNPSILKIAQDYRYMPEIQMDVESAKNYTEFMLSAPNKTPENKTK